MPLGAYLIPLGSERREDGGVWKPFPDADAGVVTCALRRRLKKVRRFMPVATRCWCNVCCFI